MVRPRTRKDRTLDWEQPETLTRRAFFGRRWVTTRTVMVLDAMGYGARQARNSMEYECGLSYYPGPILGISWCSLRESRYALKESTLSLCDLCASGSRLFAKLLH